MKLKNKVVIITGASDGIGKQIALRLAKEEVQLILIARNELKLKELVIQTKNLGAKNVKEYVCDISKTEELNEMIKNIKSDFENVDILINVAGIWQKLMPSEEISQDTVYKVIATNLSALIMITNSFLPILKKRSEAAIINIISKSGIVAQEKQAVYTASKYGVRGFTEVLKTELKGSTVRIAGVYQSGTNTLMFEKTGDHPPLEKFTRPEDLADVIGYMLSLPEKIWLHDVYVEY